MSAPPLRADQEVARILAETDSEEEIYRLLLAAIGDSLGWDFGAMWEVVPRRRAALHRRLVRARLLGGRRDFAESPTRRCSCAAGVCPAPW